MRHILALCCANGLGHLRRVVGILSRLRVLRPELRIDLVCESWQVERLAFWPRLARLRSSGLGLIHGVTAPGVEWSADPATYTDGRLRTWEDRLAEVAALKTADCVLSDNLSAVLDHRPDAVLSGSFLWSEVLAAAHPESPEVAAFARRERKRLERHRPPMLCVADLAMPQVLAAPAAVPLPWMCEDPVRSADSVVLHPPRPCIAVAGGATGAATAVLGGVVRALVEALRTGALDTDLALPSALRPHAAGLPAERLHPFHATTFATAAVMVCRPGVGTLTDCVAHRLPLVAVHETGNPEMEHNGRRVAELGLGRYLGTDPAPETLVDSLTALITPSTRERVRGTMALLPNDGLEQAARWLAEHRIPS